MTNEQFKILLIEPPFFRLYKTTYSLDRYPLSLAYLAGAILKETSWHVTVYNADFYHKSESIKVGYLAGSGFDNHLNNLNNFKGPIWQEIRSVINNYKPTVVGITAKSQNFASACIVAKIAKEFNSYMPVIVGGPHPSMVGSSVMNCPDIDICVIGEGERTIVELLNALETGKKFNNIQGIIYRKNEQIIENQRRSYIEDLDSLCFPNDSAPEVLKDYNLYPSSAFHFIFATRGCPYNCFFCGSREIWSRTPRFRSPENVTREIRNLQKKGLKLIHFNDDTFGINSKYIKDLCNAIMYDCPGLIWSCEIHIKLVNDELISLMKKTGCYAIQIGIESGNNSILKEMRKNITVEEAFSACRTIRKYGIKLQLFFMIGFPQETEETLKDTVNAMKKIKCDFLCYSIFTPYPGTEAFEYCKKNGLITDAYNIALYNHQSPANCFSINISQDRFRVLACPIEKMTDRINWYNKIKRIFLYPP